jgi:predicted Rdx family selenoprotein
MGWTLLTWVANDSSMETDYIQGCLCNNFQYDLNISKIKIQIYNVKHIHWLIKTAWKRQHVLERLSCKNMLHVLQQKATKRKYIPVTTVYKKSTVISTMKCNRTHHKEKLILKQTLQSTAVKLTPKQNQQIKRVIKNSDNSGYY